MKVTIFRVKLNHLWNSEYSMFVSQLVGIFLKYQPEALHLKKAFERLTALMPELAKIKAQELSNAISNQLVELDNERDTLFNAIVAQVKNMGKLSLASIAPHVVVMNRFLDIHGRDIAAANYNAETKRINDMLTDYNSKVEVKAASDSLTLTIFFQQLTTVNTQFANLFLQRTEENAATETVDARAIRAETDKVLVAFFDAFEFCSSEYDELDYQTPANEMNDLISYYKTQLKTRATRRSSGKDVHTEDPIKPE
jgi:hypothetical protein